jgi:hypothetical protein
MVFVTLIAEFDPVCYDVSLIGGIVAYYIEEENTKGIVPTQMIGPQVVAGSSMRLSVNWYFGAWFWITSSNHEERHFSLEPPSIPLSFKPVCNKKFHK